MQSDSEREYSHRQSPTDWHAHSDATANHWHTKSAARNIHANPDPAMSPNIYALRRIRQEHAGHLARAARCGAEEMHCQPRTWFEGWKKLRGLPETVRIHGGRGTVPLSDAWVKFLDRINTEDAQRFLRKEQSGWLNHGPFPKMEQLTFGGNYVEVTRISGHKAYIKSFNNADPPPASAPNTLIQTFSVVYSNGTWEMSTPVGAVYTFIIANPDDGTLWIDLDNLIRP